MENTHGIHIRNKKITVEEIVAVDVSIGFHRNVVHSHKNAYELIYISDGHMVVQIDGIWTDMNSGSCVLIPKDTMHDSQSETESAKIIYIAFASNDDFSFLEKKFVQFSEDDREMVERLFSAVSEGYLDMIGNRNIYTLVHTQDSPFGMEQLALNYLEILLLLATRVATENQERVSNISHEEKSRTIAENATAYIADQVNRYIEEHYREDLTVDKVAKHFDYSRSRISVIYKKETGSGINEAINRVKLIRARNLLIESEMSISEISEYLGFSSPQYFSNRFTKSTGMSPSSYAKFKHTKVN